MIFATLQNFCNSIIAPTYFSYWLSQFDHQQGGAMMKSPIAKRSIVVNGHKTSVSLEDEYWTALKEIAAKRLTNVSDFVSAIDRQRQHGNLSSALRLFVLDFYRSQVLEIRANDGLNEMMRAPPPRAQ